MRGDKCVKICSVLSELLTTDLNRIRKRNIKEELKILCSCLFRVARWVQFLFESSTAKHALKCVNRAGFGPIWVLLQAGFVFTWNRFTRLLVHFVCFGKITESRGF